MIFVDILALMILFFSFIGGLKEGAVKQLFSLLVLIIAIPVTGIFYWLIATIISFMPGTDWENFIGFFITLAMASIILHAVFFLPRKMAQKLWQKGLPSRLLGGALNLFNAGIGLAVLALVFGAYPIIDWLANAVTNAGVLEWLVAHLGFVRSLMPEIFRHVSVVAAILSYVK